jgi:hypothetical protein
MEDSKHFLAQNGLNGAVFFVFAISFWLIFQRDEALGILLMIINMPNASVIVSGLFAAILAPIIGFLIQGIVLAFFYLKSLSAYNDPSRALIAGRVRENINADSRISEEIKKRLASFADDWIFVAVYYQEAPASLIEWARRRRDSQHLGENWTTAAACGVIFAYVAQLIASVPEGPRIQLLKGLAIAALLVWGAGFLYMRKMMKKEADGMELVWTLSHLYPSIYMLTENERSSSPTTAAR